MKHLFKRFAAGITAACMCMALVVPMESSADTTYQCGDVNRDGQISMLDLTHLNKYLAGMIELADYSLADTTGNYVVNAVDAEILQSFLVMAISGNLPYTVSTERIVMEGFTWNFVE